MKFRLGTRSSVVLICLGTVLFSETALTQDIGTRPARRFTTADYAQANRMNGYVLSSKLKNALVIPHWIGQGDEFWYDKDTEAGHTFVIVEAMTGRTRAAFDHQAIAAALSDLYGKPLTANNLPFRSIEVAAAEDQMHVEFEGRAYDCDLKQSKCAAGELKPVLPEPLTFASRAPTSATASIPDLQTGSAQQARDGVLPSPNGHWGVLTRRGNLWLRNLDAGGERQLTEDGEGPNLGYGIYTGGWKAASIVRERAEAGGFHQSPMASYWSPDSRTVIVPFVDQRTVADYPMVETAPGDGSFRPKLHLVRVPLVGEVPPVVQWVIFDIPGGSYHRIKYPYDKLLAPQQDLFAIRKVWWSSDHQHLYSAAFGENMESAFLFDVELATGKVRTVIEEHMMPRMDLNSTSYNEPNVWVSPDGKYVIWYSERDGWGHLYLYDGATGKLINQITKGDWLVRDLLSVDEMKRQIYFSGAGREGGNPYFRYLYRVNFDGSDLQLLSPEHADHPLTSPENDVLSIDGAQGYQVVSPNGKYVVYNYSTPVAPTETVLRSSDGTLVATFERADARELFAAGYQVPEEFVAKSADGKDNLWCLLYKPRRLDPNQKYPVVDVEYASPLTAVVPRNFTWAINGVPAEPPGAETLTELGFVVVVVDGKGTTYRSREFSQANYGKLNTNGLDDHVAAIKQIAEKYPWIDVNRVGIIGGSFGGWSALRGMLEFPDFYKVGIAASAPGSLHNQYLDYHWYSFQGPPLYSDGSDLRPKPSEVPVNYNSVDSRQEANRLKGHLMILMGELDENALPGSILQFVDALEKANKDFDLIYMPNKNHVTGYGAYTTRRIEDYFVRYLMQAEPPPAN